MSDPDRIWGPSRRSHFLVCGSPVLHISYSSEKWETTEEIDVEALAVEEDVVTVAVVAAGVAVVVIRARRSSGSLLPSLAVS